MKKSVVITALLLIGSCGDPAGPSGAEGWNNYTTDDVVFQWRVENDGATLHVKLSAPTTGWVAVGFDPSVMMKDANLVIGYVEDGTGYIRDDFGTGATTHEADTALGGTSDVTLIDSGETGNETEIDFSIPMSSGDQYDASLTQGETYTILLAYGPSGGDDFTSAHQFVRTVSLELL
ncbi:MAG: DOMON domain-containing protein [Candidatus Fermentibacteraceae bacterium]